MPSQSSQSSQPSHDEFEFGTVAPQGRRYPTTTSLGRIMASQGLRVYTVGSRAAVAPRTMTDYLAGRKAISAEHLTRLCVVLGCEPEDLV